MKRRTLGRFGRRGDQVRVLLDRKAERVEVQYKDRAGLPHKRIFEATKAGQAAALTWAETYHTERARREAAKLAPPDTTMRQLWAAFAASPSFCRTAIPTQRAYRERFGLWMAFMGEDTLPGHTTLADVDRFLTRMDTLPTKRGVPRAMNHAAHPAPKANHALPTLRRAGEPPIPRVAYGVPNRMERLSAIGDAVVPRCAEVIGRRLLELETSLKRPYRSNADDASTDLNGQQIVATGVTA